MKKKLQSRDYQIEFENAIINSWRTGVQNVLGVLPTGAGKTFSFAKILGNHQGAAVAIAHRQELVAQISVALAQHRVFHQIVGPLNVVKFAVARQIEMTGSSYYKQGARVTVAGVDTIKSRYEKLKNWGKSITLWVQDEAHHILKNNKWGKAAELFPNARGLGVTATPVRADGNGLGRHVDGLIDVMVEGPGMRELINRGYLTDYRIFSPPSNLNLENVKITNTGDYSKPQLKKEIQKSTIIGDVVEHYKRIAPNKLGVTFAVDVETASQIAEQYRAAGVSAEVVSHKTPDQARAAILRQFSQRRIMQLVNVDLFGEGFDLPAIEVCSFARPTESFALYCQQFGRALRLLEGKDKAIIIDHVGNIIRHNLPDALRVWSLDRRDKRGRMNVDGMIPLMNCVNCAGVYERTHIACPYCGHVPIPANRSRPEFVDGDLYELDPAVLAQMRGDVESVNMDLEQYRLQLIAQRVPLIGQMANVKRLADKQQIQAQLRSVMAWYAGMLHAQGHTNNRENHKRFFFDFGVDVLTAQTLAPREAIALGERIVERMIRL